MTMKLWKRKMQSWYNRGTVIKWLFYTEWCYLRNLWWNDCNLCLCTKYKSCNNCIVNKRGEVSENDTSLNGGVKMLYGFFRNQNYSDRHTIFKTEQLINVHMFISYFLIISKEFIQSGSPWICYKKLLKVPKTSSSDNNWSTSKRTKRNKLPLFKWCKPNIHYPSAHWNENVGKNLHFLNSPCEIRQIKAKITLV